MIEAPASLRRGPFLLATAMAALGWFALASELIISLGASVRHGHGVGQAIYLYLRFFTILTNGFLAALMTITAWRLVRREAPPGAGAYAAALTYIVVVSLTYEALLRHLWSPQGLQFYTDMTMHDVIPGLMLIFWIAFAPKAGLRWRDPLRWLEFPAVYFAAILGAGLLGADYPYGFLNPVKIGYGRVFANAVVFLAIFYGLGLLLTLAGRARTGRIREEAGVGAI